MIDFLYSFKLSIFDSFIEIKLSISLHFFERKRAYKSGN